MKSGYEVDTPRVGSDSDLVKLAGNLRSRVIQTTSILCLSGAAFLGSAGVPAQAGSNGQQISFCASGKDPHGVAVARGTNQNGDYVSSTAITLTGWGACAPL